MFNQRLRNIIVLIRVLLGIAGQLDYRVAFLALVVTDGCSLLLLRSHSLQKPHSDHDENLTYYPVQLDDCRRTTASDGTKPSEITVSDQAGFNFTG